MDHEEKERLYEVAEKLLSEQNFGRALIFGAAAYFVKRRLSREERLAIGMY